MGEVTGGTEDSGIPDVDYVMGRATTGIYQYSLAKPVAGPPKVYHSKPAAGSLDTS
jgi:hypothetical protein